MKLSTGPNKATNFKNWIRIVSFAALTQLAGHVHAQIASGPFVSNTSTERVSDSVTTREQKIYKELSGNNYGEIIIPEKRKYGENQFITHIFVINKNGINVFKEYENNGDIEYRRKTLEDISETYYEHLLEKIKAMNTTDSTEATEKYKIAFGVIRGIRNLNANIEGDYLISEESKIHYTFNVKIEDGILTLKVFQQFFIGIEDLPEQEITLERVPLPLFENFIRALQDGVEKMKVEQQMPVPKSSKRNWALG